MFFSVLFIASTCPFPYGQNGMEKCLQIPNSSHISFNSFPSNYVPVSKVIEFDIPSRRIMFIRMTLQVLASMIFMRGSASTHFMKYPLPWLWISDLTFLWVKVQQSPCPFCKGPRITIGYQFLYRLSWYGCEFLGLFTLFCKIHCIFSHIWSNSKLVLGPFLLGNVC